MLFASGMGGGKLNNSLLFCGLSRYDRFLVEELNDGNKVNLIIFRVHVEQMYVYQSRAGKCVHEQWHNAEKKNAHTKSINACIIYLNYTLASDIDEICSYWKFFHSNMMLKLCKCILAMEKPTSLPLSIYFQWCDCSRQYKIYC